MLSLRLTEIICCAGLLIYLLPVFFCLREPSRNPLDQLRQNKRDVPISLPLPPPAANFNTSVPTLSLTPSQEPSFVLFPGQAQDPIAIIPILGPSNDFNSSRTPTSDGTDRNGCPSRALVMGYYPDWVSFTFPPEKIDFKRFDWIDFAFAVPNTKFALQWDEPQTAPKLLKRLVSLAHAANTKVKLSIGGWTGSKHFSPAVSTDQSRRTLVNNIASFYKTYNLDGIDLDWEYPGHKGAHENTVNSNDSANFLSFLKLLRSVLPATARLSAAVETVPFTNSKGNPSMDVSGFAQVLDWVVLMNYDVWGSSSKPGPNAPFRDACGNSTQPGANAVAAYNSWTSAGFPPCKLVLGLPSYGYISSSTTQRLRTRADSNAVKVINDDGDSEGQIQFRELVAQGALVRSISGDTVSFTAGGGFERRWDSCSDTPFLRSTASRQVITYDDLESLSMKAAFAKRVGMLGINFFDIHGDTDQWDLITTIRKSMALP
ncbi:unnamed protein product [Cyclocybe aegerita]|uniref:GH18 domain-containing protein n=1 Tax=Cyclocybe aegerita TaxID=1973307 RepID=A0A8S0W2L2_CYCAE|nr:unnamed protein product [Cyclocybe aegerita]